MKKVETKKKIYKNRNGSVTYEETPYGSFVNTAEYGMVQQKNARSEKDLKKYGYVRVQ